MQHHALLALRFVPSPVSLSSAESSDNPPRQDDPLSGCVPPITIDDMFAARLILSQYVGKALADPRTQRSAQPVPHKPIAAPPGTALTVGSI